MIGFPRFMRSGPALLVACLVFSFLTTFRGVPPGSYTVKIELQGFRTHRILLVSCSSAMLPEAVDA